MTCPMPRYWMCHAAVALVLALIFAPFMGVWALALGPTFYTGREFTQWESGLPFDWQGFLAPWLACGAALIIIGAIS